MSSTVFTETTCQKCGKVDRREGVYDRVPPSWIEGELSIMDWEEPWSEGMTGLGEVRTKQDIDIDALCVACGDKLLALLGVKRKRQRREKKDAGDLRPIHCDDAYCDLPRSHLGAHALPGEDPVRVDLHTLEDVDRWAHDEGAEHTHEQPAEGYGAPALSRLKEQGYGDARAVEGDCGVPECPVHHGGNAPYCLLQAEAWVKEGRVFVEEPQKYQRRRKIAFPSCPQNPAQHVHERQLDGTMVCLAPQVATFEDVEECPWAVGPHRHEVEGDTVTCTAAGGQMRVTPLPVPPEK